MRHTMCEHPSTCGKNMMGAMRSPGAYLRHVPPVGEHDERAHAAQPRRQLRH